MVGRQSISLNQNKPFSPAVSTLMPSSAEFYSFSLSGRLRAVGVNALIGSGVRRSKIYKCPERSFGS